MKTHSLFASLLVAVTVFHGVALADDNAPQPAAASKQQQPAPAGDDWVGKDAPTPAPTAQPSAPKSSPSQARPQARPATLTPNPANVAPNNYSPPETASSQTEQSAPAEQSGQWVYTDQYGWVWIPYAREYTYVASEGYPYSYVYYPSYGWMWLYSPWVFGWGPGPYWGIYGPGYYAWYAHPWFARPRFYPRGGYYGGFRAGVYYRGGAYRGGPAVRSGAYHGGPAVRSGAYHGSPVVRGGGGYRAPTSIRSGGFSGGGGFRGGGGFHGGGFHGGGGHMHR